ncbi:podocan-like protein 1 [Platysternon megacephalum]|uniref:Podocan-like protein 1 n=1 Tax=Platysternon megacephalum TaxID=55544 RepID=A0A4D9E6W0_9SAUR|nr:podocan-like protein 1 [Platysternon megacephalum]
MHNLLFACANGCTSSFMHRHKLLHPDNKHVLMYFSTIQIKMCLKWFLSISYKWCERGHTSWGGEVSSSKWHPPYDTGQKSCLVLSLDWTGEKPSKKRTGQF